MSYRPTTVSFNFEREDETTLHVRGTVQRGYGATFDDPLGEYYYFVLSAFAEDLRDFWDDLSEDEVDLIKLEAVERAEEGDYL